MSIEDGNSLDNQASAVGIIHCLRMLAEEAETLLLYRTLAAIRAAIDACRAESLQDAAAALEREDKVARRQPMRDHYH